MKILLTSDIHLTSRYPDEYRWGIFNKLKTVARQEGATAIGILGDITDEKGGHAASLVNRMVDEIYRLSLEFEVYILKGNHDYTEEHLPFFKFLDYMPNVRFISDPELVDVGGIRILALPHAHGTTTQRAGEAGGSQASSNILTGTKVTSLVKQGGFDYIWIHNTVRGSLMSNGRVMEKTGVDLCPPTGGDPGKQRRWKGVYEGAGAPILAGDVHVPQEVGPVTYLGAPHPICFGDNWLPRLVLMDSEKGIKSIPIDSIQKHSLTFLGPAEADSDLSEVGNGDQLKIVVMLNRADMGLWAEIRKKLFDAADKRGASIESISMQSVETTFLPESHTNPELARLTRGEAYEAYCKENMVSEDLEVTGQRYMD